MKALIFNSGLGSRLGKLTADKPKSMIRLSNGESVFHRQLRILSSCGIREFVVTTGPYAGQLLDESEPFRDKGCSITFVSNPAYNETNYIYSMYLAHDFVSDDDIVILHGDLVFDAPYAWKLINSPLPSIGSVNASAPLPDKDFKARIINGEIREVSVSIFDEDCVTFQPFYKLSKESMGIWLKAVEKFVNEGNTGIYAENAANTVFDQMHVTAFSYKGHYVEEIDTPEDLRRVSAGIANKDFAGQHVYELTGKTLSLLEGCTWDDLGKLEDVPGILNVFNSNNPLIVATSHFSSLNISQIIESSDIGYALFTGFSPNPTDKDVDNAVEAYRASGCDSLMSVGGGSAIDIAKCAKQVLAMPAGTTAQDLSSGNLPYTSIPHIAIPTTAGTGSESTHFAVCYIDDVKNSVSNPCLIPDAVLLDSSALAGLSRYQKKCCLLDALCQAIESYWSFKSSRDSRAYAKEAILAIMAYWRAYLDGNEQAARKILFAANRAGKAINLTTTTAPHAMSYKLTSLYGIPHGHAVAECMPGCWQYLIDKAGKDTAYRLIEISALMTASTNRSTEDGLDAFRQLYETLEMPCDWKPGNLNDLDELVGAVNVERLSNFPISMERDDIKAIYSGILE